jgi:pimeloyl-ACP methyl ester carboxylesterase
VRIERFSNQRINAVRAALGAVLAVSLLGASAPQVPAVPATATLPDGATYRIEVPTNWNGTLLLYSHGYNAPGDENPALDVDSEIVALRPTLFSRGYALAGSSYAGTGYAVEDGLRDQMATLDEFVRRYGKPKRTIAWGHSLGGLISIGLIERHPDRFDGALPMCGILAGTRATWNQVLDSEFAFKVLAAPEDSTLALVHIHDPAANYQIARRIFEAAEKTPAGRARLALAAAFNEEPGWDPSTPSRPSDRAGQLAAMLRWLENPALAFGFLFRAELEARAGGNPSGNAGESYLDAFRKLPQRDLIVAAYKDAQLDLDADLRALDATPRITPDAAAEAYAKANTDAGATLPVPVLTLHTVADGLVPVGHERNYAEAVPAAARAANLRQLFVNRAGHCAFTSEETLVALESLEARLQTGSWPNLDPHELREAAAAYGDALGSFQNDDGHDVPSAPAFIDFIPKGFLR